MSSETLQDYTTSTKAGLEDRQIYFDDGSGKSAII